MLRIMMLALLVGSVVSISAISFFKGFDMEGALIGLTSLILLFGITSLFYVEFNRFPKEVSLFKRVKGKAPR
ncbi:hypothetical protein MHZ92_14765 [Sporosarcina sp. ACRSL]|uniref:hypothetical protein n=1 Tax=Sporosarcina sp. ACRSL TaxID=2918215 RepID=UPI001EF61552|nr:hypothetical protein [Sporosarcina sp. ACRSL]MCG7345397.1 hypothetical protein [Sporosarcina sp. ACRSL]